MDEALRRMNGTSMSMYMYMCPGKRYEDGSDRGSFGEVYKYDIHPNHLVDPKKSAHYKYVAVKEIPPRSDKDRQTIIEGWEKEASVLQKMNALQQEHIVRFLTAFRHGDQGREDHYLMFEWADGGNLLNLWKTTAHPLTPRLVKAAVKQILGLANALCNAHYPKTGPTFRHGDLKPANILWFKNNDGSDEMGTLKIADWGLAKQHNVVTELRANKTSTEYGTRRYEPPRRRLAWLRRFNSSIRSEYSNSPPFYQITSGNSVKVARIHDVAVQWMDHIAKDPRCEAGRTALGNLLELVQTGLLVVKLPDRLGTSTDLSLSRWPSRSRRTSAAHSERSIASEINTTDAHRPSNADIPGIVVSEADESPPPPNLVLLPSPELLRGDTGGGRVLADDFARRMEYIYLEDDDDNYWFPDVGVPPVPPGAGEPDQVENQGEDVDSGAQSTRQSTWKQQFQGASSGTAKLTVPQQERVDYGNAELDNNWARSVNNELAAEVFANVQQRTRSIARPEATPTSKLCRACRSFREGLWKPAFSQTYELSDLEAAAKEESCDLCGLFWRTWQRLGGIRTSSVLLEREGSSLRMNAISDPALSILRSPDLRTPIGNSIQIGFPDPSAAPIDAQFEIIRKWLSQCNSRHSCCQTNTNNKDTNRTLPTRLINVGRPGDTQVRLVETSSSTELHPASDCRWLALSHQWGPRPHFCTTPSTLSSHLAGIPLASLPSTFRDAVAVTRELGCAYLWIDSLCVVQGPGGDFNTEAKRMEQVYSGAYCVLAVSRSRGDGSGFLHSPRKGRDYVSLRDEGLGPEAERKGVSHICQNVDDFNAHVLAGELNGRGWVLQERALARRTVFFTDWQMYWECGQGILMDAGQAERILRCQDLFKRYSRLALTNSFDRPLAIDGLQARILAALDSKGGFGVLDEGARKKGLLRRSLLWCRDAETARLERIVFPPDRAISVVPSWSWMAYTGGIDYISPEFDQVEWAEMQSPWSGADEPVPSALRRGNIPLVAKAWEYDARGAKEGEGMLIFDTPGQSQQSETLCVVLGCQKGSTQKNYLMLVQPTAVRDQSGTTIYERIGAGYLPAKCLGRHGKRITIY
ncbi:hypothetical protein C8A01DRAFT_50215 [Parachaetomium inaequale]|uniref:Protein kinase domain-containing protein n=1 Tax=Parachaetomium inaequale TaxID=2588326 RepID=A0AAN6P7F0_9PEZI|nr:hypothetical protein C8A01DRAFT_50215 [Parachaetomium inaequale]